MPYRNKIQKVWIAQVRFQDKRYQKTFSLKKDATKWEKEKLEKLKSNNLQQIPTTSLLDFATQYLDYSKTHHVKKTYEEKLFAFRIFFKSIDSSLEVRELHKGDVLSHLQKQAQDRSGYAANKDRKNLVAAWNWGAEYIEGFPTKNPFLVKRFSEVRSPRYVPPEEDFWKIYHVAESDQDRIMLLSFLHLAARRNEIFSLRCEDVDLKRKQIKLYTRKRKDGSLEFDWLPLTNRLYKDLKSILEESRNEWLFPNPKTGIPYVYRQKWVPRLCMLAEVKSFGLHGIRHLTASILIKNEVSLIDIQTVLRHKKLTTTERYLHRLEGVRSALEVFDK